MADVDGVAQIEMFDNSSSISSIMVHVVAVGHLSRAPVAAPVDSDHAIPLLEEEQHLGIPVVG